MLSKIKELITEVHSSDKDKADNARRLLSVLILSLILMTTTGLIVISS